MQIRPSCDSSSGHFVFCWLGIVPDHSCKAKSIFFTPRCFSERSGPCVWVTLSSLSPLLSLLSLPLLSLLSCTPAISRPKVLVNQMHLHNSCLLATECNSWGDCMMQVLLMWCRLQAASTLISVEQYVPFQMLPSPHGDEHARGLLSTHFATAQLDLCVSSSCTQTKWRD